MKSIYFLNLIRWMKENLIVWFILVFIYSLVATIVLEAAFQIIFKYEAQKVLLWGILFCGLLSAYLFESIAVELKLRSVPVFIKNRYAKLYALHELRRGNGWIYSFVLGLAALFLGKIHVSFILLIYLLVVQRALFSLWKWRRLFASFEAVKAAQGWYFGAFYVQCVHCIVFLAPVCFSLSYLSMSYFIKVFCACFGGLFASLSFCFEGDSGTPVMVNLITLSAGVLGAFLSFYSPWIALLLLYVWWNMSTHIQNRFLSVEKLDEDFIIS